MRSVRHLLFLGIMLGLAVTGNAETKTILILHTNDMHDHIRTGYNGLGGLPYVSGYIKSVESERNDVIVLDGGDITEKGDMVAFKTENKAMYEAVAKIGYTACAPGNHDTGYGVEYMLERARDLQGAAMLCINYAKPDGTQCFAPSKLVDVNGVKAALIGVTLPNGGETMEFEECAKAVEKEAARVKEEAHVVIVFGHLGSKACRRMSALAPDVQVFVGGHTHEVIESPIVVERTGALIVQAGEYAQHVGRLELTVDLEKRTIEKYDGKLVKMEHGKVPCDTPLQAWVQEQENKVCPEAARVIAKAAKPVGRTGMGLFAAMALKWQSHAEIAFCHPGQVIRSGLPSGDLDINAFFLTGGQRGNEIVKTTLAGSEIEAYVAALMTFSKGQTQWAGFKGETSYDSATKEWKAITDLEPARKYSVVLPKLEWKTRFEKVLEKRAKKSGEASQERDTDTCEFTFIDAISGYAEWLGKEDIGIDAHVDKLAAEVKLKVAVVR